MFQRPPTVSSTLWEPSPEGNCLSTVDFKPPQLSAARSYNLGLKFEHGKLRKVGSTCRTIYSVSRKPSGEPSFRKRNASPQNVDLPAALPKQKKKPYPIPLKQIKQASKVNKKLAEKGIEKPLDPPKNGLLDPDLIPVAHQVLDAWKTLIKGLAQLLHVIPVYGCLECSEVHVAQSGHQMQDCLAYHLYDPFGRRIKHETRFQYDRIPAIVELCIQAGVDIPEYPSRRRTKPIRMIGKKVIDRGGFVEEPEQWHAANPSSLAIADLDTHGASERFPPPLSSDIPKIAQETLDAYETVKSGVTKLMKKCSVKACGYCPEVHVGPWGHNAKLCGEFKHQWRDGKHGWQDAMVDEVFPPNYVWHVKDPKGPPMKGGALKFYGKVPAVVELCLQAGAQIPEKYKPMMRLDIVVPEIDEALLVA
ncbi:hypothetical protein ACLB2K_025401 [Fragaria x ananassa]